MMVVNLLGFCNRLGLGVVSFRVCEIRAWGWRISGVLVGYNFALL